MFYTGVPEGSEVIGYAVDGVGGVDFPVGGEGGLCVGDVEEHVYPSEASVLYSYFSEFRLGS